ncbi:MAG: thiamine phosphate synthase [Acidobacteria bacterium]|nr:thiamine phosphate synthase [Acidobacteriota bacterium]
MIRYYVTDRRQGDILRAAARAVRQGVDMIQVREKDLSTRELLSLVLQIRDIASGSKTKILVNDRLDVALAARVDGVHLPANGLPPDRVRPHVKTLGVSTHTLEDALAAQAAQADFIVFGPIFDTPGKQAIGLEPLRRVVTAVTIPVLAIGGVTADNTIEILEAGAAGIAGIRLFQGE